MPFSDRFEYAQRPFGARIPLCFKEQVSTANAIKDDWAFIWEDALRYNIAYALQEVHFDILLVNNYNVFGAIKTLKLKHTLVQIASVAEAVLQYMLQMIEGDQRVRKALSEEGEWKWLDYSDPTQGRIHVPEGHRVVAGIQHRVQAALHRNTKMKTLIKAAQRAEIIDESMAAELDGLREQRNRVHIKSLTAPEYADYTPKMANEALDTLERFRTVAVVWTVAERKEAATGQAAAPDVDFRSVPSAMVGDFTTPDDDIPF